MIGLLSYRRASGAPMMRGLGFSLLSLGGLQSSGLIHYGKLAEDSIKEIIRLTRSYGLT